MLVLLWMPFGLCLNAFSKFSFQDECTSVLWVPSAGGTRAVVAKGAERLWEANNPLSAWLGSALPVVTGTQAQLF